MSAMIALFLVLSTLAGCAGETLANVKNALPAPAPPSYSVELEVYEDTFFDSGGDELASCHYEIPVLSSSGGGESACDAFNAAFASWRESAGAVAQAAREDRAALGPAAPYLDELYCRVYQTERLVSVAGTYTTYTGGAHGNSILLSWNFDLESGTFFDPATLDEDAGFHDAVVRSLRDQAAKRAQDNGLSPADFFWADYGDTLENWSSYAVSFDEAGMTVGFSPYELACYAAGEQVFTIPYADLEPHLGSQGRALLGLDG